MSPETAVIPGSVWIRTRSAASLQVLCLFHKDSWWHRNPKAFLVFRGDVSATLGDYRTNFQAC